MRTLDPFHFSFGLALLLFALAAAGGCGSGTPANSSTAPRASSTPSSKAPAASAASSGPSLLGSASAPETPPKAFDPCAKSGPVPHEYFGILSAARCEQEMYLAMSEVAFQLGVECKYCHVPHPTNPKEEIYPPMTPKKETANWMKMHLMASIKPVNGEPMKCRMCHTDAAGKPVAKILGNPRDIVKAQEWMSMVMVNKFVTLKGEKLKCKSCHVGNFATPGFQAKVILKNDQIPPH